MFKDGKVVVAHDNNLSRLTGQSTLIRNTCFSDLPLIQERKYYNIIFVILKAAF